MIREGLSKEGLWGCVTSMTSRQQLCESEGGNFAGRETSKCEAPRMKTRVVFSKNIKVSVAEVDV